MAEGRFIVFEGIDGSGTTTQSKLAAEWLRSRAVEVVETFEPTDGLVGRILRQALSCEMPGSEGEELTPELFALLFAADRMDHVKGKILPALERGAWVVSDRCYLSSFAYQSIGCDLEWVRTLNRYVRRADRTFLLDVEAEVAFERLAGVRKEREVFETLERMARIRTNYLKIAARLREEGERIITLDAARPVDAVAENVRKALAELL